MKKLILVFLFCSQWVFGQVTIQDIQYSNNGASPFEGQGATLTGIVTASAEAGNLGYVFMQQDSVMEWGGIQLKGNPQLLDMKIGDLVTATGTVVESGGMTTLDQITQLTVLDTGWSVDPVIVEPDEFTYYHIWDTEKYEGMLVQLGYEEDSLVIVRQNADTTGNNFGEYKVGADTALPDTGCRVLAGRVTSTLLSSLDVSYVNDSIWMNNSGIMNVPPIIVQVGDAWQGIRGIMTQSFGNMVLVPRNNDDFIPLAFGTNIQDQIPSLELRLFPNPADEYVILRTQLERPENMRIEIIGMDGKVRLVLNEMMMREGLIRVSIDDMASGIYFMRITGDQLTASKKFLKR